MISLWLPHPQHLQLITVESHNRNSWVTSLSMISVDALWIIFDYLLPQSWIFCISEALLFFFHIGNQWFSSPTFSYQVSSWALFFIVASVPEWLRHLIVEQKICGWTDGESLGKTWQYSSLHWPDTRWDEEWTCNKLAPCPRGHKNNLFRLMPWKVKIAPALWASIASEELCFPIPSSFCGCYFCDWRYWAPSSSTHKLWSLSWQLSSRFNRPLHWWYYWEKAVL